MARSGQWLLTLALLASAGGLLFGLLSQQARTAADLPEKKALPAVPNEGAAAEQPVLVDEISEPVPLSEFVDMIMRPLFSPSRRPAPTPVDGLVPDTPQVAIAPARTNQFMVMGIVIAQDEKVALLKELKNSNEILRVKEGQKLSDWTVSEITPESVTIEQRGVTDVVKLSDNILSTAEKQKLVQQAKLEQATTANKQQLRNRRPQVNNRRRDVRQIPRRIRANPQNGKRAPRQAVRTPTR